MLKKIWHIAKRILIIIIGILVLMYVALWVFSFKNYNTQFGVSFSPEYATFLGLDWKDAYNEVLTDLKPPLIRISVPWNKVEPQNGSFNFTDTDYLVNEAAKNNAKILLALGQKIPRWPECYFPQWFREAPKDERSAEVFEYIQAVVERYKNNPAIDYWQVENEAFIRFDFGECDGFNKEIVHDEIRLVKHLDPTRKVMTTDSGELSVWYSASKSGDVLGSTLYRLIISRYGFLWHYEYLPAGLYRLKARLFGNSYEDFFISELQGEPWFHNGSALNTEMSTQEKTMSAAQLKKNITYARYVGASRVYLWGTEWWYWLKKERGNPVYWDIAKETFKSSILENN